LCNERNGADVRTLQPLMTDHYQLVRDCLKNRPEAQRLLYDSFSEQMLGICFRYTKSRADAEDVLQEGFVRVFKNLHQFKFEGELGGWIRKVMVNTAINYLKKHSRYQSDLSFSDAGLHPISADNPEVNLSAKELAELVRQLPTGYQTVFNLHAVEGYTHVEIGQMLGISENTSRSQYMRARNLLITWIENFSREAKQESYVRK
jgi:RNA polymerase sigma factor (sigma-70 family)